METENKGLIDVRDCPCDGCQAKPCGHPARCVKFTLWLNKTVDAVSGGVHDQVRWERDIAMEQLKEHGIPFGGIAPDVVKVVRCKDCKHSYNGIANIMCGRCGQNINGIRLGGVSVKEEHFCSYGERKDNDL